MTRQSLLLPITNCQLQWISLDFASYDVSIKYATPITVVVVSPAVTTQSTLTPESTCVVAEPAIPMTSVREFNSTTGLNNKNTPVLGSPHVQIGELDQIKDINVKYVKLHQNSYILNDKVLSLMDFIISSKNVFSSNVFKSSSQKYRKNNQLWHVINKKIPDTKQTLFSSPPSRPNESLLHCLTLIRLVTTPL
ncbi:LOW QUALITY PROTEIN: hypothetical protein YC2023_047218 [Brassica napus]